MRWIVLVLLFLATTINYLDRAILGILLPEIRKDLILSTEVYGTITFWFQIAYAAGSFVGGGFLDRLGTRVGYGLAAAWWSAAAVLNSLARSALQFGVFRLMLGLGEAPNFPACNKAIAEWFPPSERAAAMGIVNSGTNVANIVGPPLFIWLSSVVGWQACFAIMGGAGFVWLPFWFFTYRTQHEPVALGPQAVRLRIRDILQYRQTWGYAIAKFFTDPVWWFYLFWLNPYLADIRHFTPGERGAAISIVYAISALGSLAGGFASSFLMKRGWAVGKARKTVMLFCAGIMPIVGLGVVVEDNRLAVLLFGLAAAAHQAWMSNLFTTPGDVFPKHAIGSANGFGVSVGALGGALFSGLIPGFVIPLVGYVPVLLTMSCFYLVAWGFIHKLLGNYEPVILAEPVPATT